MSSTPSPTKRSVLSPKPSNISSPFRKANLNLNPFTKSTQSPLVHNKPSAVVATPSKKPKLNFTIYEDAIAASSDSPSSFTSPVSNKQNHYDQENILQPKKLASPVHRPNGRTPLANLNINQFAGYIHYPSGGESRPLTQLYQPSSFDNDFNSLHKQANIPCYLTPSRAHKDKYIVRSSFYDDSINVDAMDDIETDEAELTLMKKQLSLSHNHSINTTNLVRKHRRSLSVGKNDSKLKFIRKNPFTILSN